LQFNIGTDGWTDTDNKCNLPAEFEATTVYENKVFRKSGPTKYEVFEK